MAGTKISALPAAGSFLLADELPVNEAGTTKKATGAQIQSTFLQNLNVHLVSTLVGAPATSALGTNVTSVTLTGNDMRGSIAVVTSGAHTANTIICTITYAAGYGSAPGLILFGQAIYSGGVQSINFYVSSSIAASFQLFADTALATGTYTIPYLIIG